MRLIGRKSHLLTGTLIVGLVFCAGAVVPQHRRMTRLRHFADALRADVESTRTRLELAAELHSAAHLESALGSAFDDAIPVGDQVGEFLQTVSVLADELGLRDKDVVLAPEIDLVLDTGVKQVIGLPIEISFQGEFEAVHAFLARIESLPRLARVQRLELAASQDRKGVLMSSMTVLVFYRHS